jgi:hypothetical protein
LYDTVFQCRGGTIFVLRVDLTRTEPLVQLYGCHAVHPLIDADMYVRIAYHDRKLFGVAVLETIAAMQLNPPRILSFTDHEVEAMQPPVPPPPLLTPGPAFEISVIAEEVGPATISSLTRDLEPRLSFKDQAQTVLGEDNRYPWAVVRRMLDNSTMIDPSAASLVTYDEY